MNIIPLITNLENTFNESFKTNLDFFNLESKITNIGDNFTLELYTKVIKYLDDNFMISKERKAKYYVKEFITRNILTSIGYVSIKFRAYVDKVTKERYVFIRDVLNLKPYQRITDEAEYQLTKYAMEENMSQSARHAIRNNEVSRSIVSKLIKNFKGTVKEQIKRVDSTPNILYIEMDEIHANLQIKGNKGKSKNQICPCAIVHEGYVKQDVKRKKLKNVRNFATAKLSYSSLWEIIYDYVSQKYDIDKIDYLFVSGDGAKGIKDYSNVFPNAIFVLDKFHYKKKYLSYIFKDNLTLLNIADEYLRNDMIDEFKALVSSQIKLFPDQKEQMIEKQNYILNNLDGIKNQKHPMYKCPCSMEGHVSNRYARYITSSPYAFSLDGLENKLQLLVLRANNFNLKFEDFLELKYGKNHFKEILDNIKKITNIKYRIKVIDTNIKKTININAPLPKFDNNATQDFFNNLISQRMI